MQESKDIYSALIHAYDYFNRTLFLNSLPGCIITFQRKAKSLGYFHGDIWENVNEENRDEIALNPDYLKTRNIKETLSTLAHEMVHLQQHHYGKPGKRGYHNKEWAELMLAIDLRPTSTGTIDGKMTGSKMTHLIVQGGRFDVAAQNILDEGFTIPWHKLTNTTQSKAKRASKTKYTCGMCGANVWGKPDLEITCAPCGVLFEPEEI